MGFLALYDSTARTEYEICTKNLIELAPLLVPVRPYCTYDGRNLYEAYFMSLSSYYHRNIIQIHHTCSAGPPS